jgi:hypothetical protein
MVVRASPHALTSLTSLTSLTFNDYQPSFALPILGCVPGLVYLAFSSQNEPAPISERFAHDVVRLDVGPLMHIDRGHILGKAIQTYLAEIRNTTDLIHAEWAGISAQPGPENGPDVLWEHPGRFLLRNRRGRPVTVPLQARPDRL